MTRVTSAALVVLVCTFLTTPLLGQRRGLFVAAGGAAAFANINSLFSTDDTKLGAFGFVEVGGTPSERAQVGVELSYWRGSDADTAREHFKVTANIHLLLNPQVPLALKAGFGAGRYAEVSTNHELSSNGFVFDVGAEYHFQLSRRFSFGPFFTYSVSPDQGAKRNKLGVSSRLDFTLLRLGAYLRWQ